MVAIVSRAQWGAAHPMSPNRVPLSERRFFVLHWPGGGISADERAMLRAIERQHVVGQGWSTIGYNYAVGASGTVYECAGRDVRAVHSPPRNRDGFGCLVMQAVGGPLTDAARRGTRALYDHLCAQAGRRLTISWHAADFATACPGPDLIAFARAGLPAPGIAPPPPPPKDEFDMASIDDLRRVVREERGRPARLVRVQPGGGVWLVGPTGRWPLRNSGKYDVNAMCGWLFALGIVASATPTDADRDYLLGVPDLEATVGITPAGK